MGPSLAVRAPIIYSPCHLEKRIKLFSRSGTFWLANYRPLIELNPQRQGTSQTTLKSPMQEAGAWGTRCTSPTLPFTWAARSSWGPHARLCRLVGLLVEEDRTDGTGRTPRRWRRRCRKPASCPGSAPAYSCSSARSQRAGPGESRLDAGGAAEGERRVFRAARSTSAPPRSSTRVAAARLAARGRHEEVAPPFPPRCTAASEEGDPPSAPHFSEGLRDAPLLTARQRWGGFSTAGTVSQILKSFITPNGASVPFPHIFSAVSVEVTRKTQRRLLSRHWASRCCRGLANAVCSGNRMREGQWSTFPCKYETLTLALSLCSPNEQYRSSTWNNQATVSVISLWLLHGCLPTLFASFLSNLCLLLFIMIVINTAS